MSGDVDGVKVEIKTITEKPSCEIEKSTASVYKLRKFACGYGWADITIRQWKGGGSISVQSDWGSYNNIWTASGERDFRQFLCCLDYGYFMTKCHPSFGYEDDWEATAKELLKRVLQDRRDGDLTVEKAREIYDAIQSVDHDAGFFWQAREWPELHDYISNDRYGTAKRKTSECEGFWKNVWPHIIAEWKSELELESQERKATS
jgi:hypothetical protein